MESHNIAIYHYISSIVLVFLHLYNFIINHISHILLAFLGLTVSYDSNFFSIFVQDIPGALDDAQVAEGLGLADIKTRDWAIFKASALKGEGLMEGLDWLSN